MFVERIKRRPRMGRVQGGARAAFATLSGGPSRKTFKPLKKAFFAQK